MQGDDQVSTKHALITGAAIRVGRATALELARAGYDIIVHANRSKENALSLKREIEALGQNAQVLLADLSDDDALDAFAKEVEDFLGERPLDLLVNNAALFEKVPFEKVTRAQYRKMFSVNLDAPFFLTQALLPLLKRAPDALVVNICDIMQERAPAAYAHYILTKAGIASMTKSLAIELAPIRVNAVSPGAVEWPENYTSEQIERLTSQIPLKRNGRNHDIALAVRHLSEAPYITGQNIHVCGGRSVVH